MKAHLVSLSVCLFLLASGGAARESAASSGCMKCHGDEVVMKAMVKPVIQASAEGEG